MQTFYPIQFLKTSVLCWISLGPFFSQAQTTYFHQNFAKTSSLVNPQPDTSQFSHIILTAPALSYHKFHKGYLELTRTRQDSATGGIIRVMRATPFLPNPETLFIQVKLSAESIQSGSVNAIYFYVGENFDPVNNSFPANGLMFGRFIINFMDNSFTVKDPETQSTSSPVGIKKMVTLTWVLNNSVKPFKYQLSPQKTDEIVAPGRYDLWIDDEAIHKGSKAYPGNSLYSPTKLSNFEMRYRNGLGKIRIHDILISDGTFAEEFTEDVIMPNPVFGKTFLLRSKEIDQSSIKLTSLNGQDIPIQKRMLAKEKTEISPQAPLTVGMYLLIFLDMQGRKRSARIVIH